MIRHGLETTLLATLLGTVACGTSPDVLGAGDDVGGDDAADVDASTPEPPDAAEPTVPPEVDGRLTINELMAANALTSFDEGGTAGDWIEIYNPTDQDISLHGYSITDDLTDARKHTFGADVVVPTGGYLVLWADDTPEAGAAHVGFALKREGGEIGLARPDGSWIDRVAYGEQQTDLSAARVPDGSAAWRIEWHASPGAANASGDGPPVGPEDPAAPPEAVPAAGDLTDRILGYDVLLEIEFEVPPESVASLEAQPYAYVPATLVYEGRSYGPVGLRLKGQNSFQPFAQKPSLRINVDEYVEGAKFFGLDDLTLNNMDNDLSMMHERLAYLIARVAGIPASRANHALVTVNGQFYGLYTNVETVKKKMVKRWFADDAGSLFEGTDVDFVASYISSYEHEFGADDRSLLSGLAQALTLANANTAIAAAGNHANVAQFRRFWAMASVVAQLDSFPYSVPGDDYFVYADPTTGRLHFLPWGMDESFYAGRADVTNVYSVLARRCREAPACFQDYVDQTWEVLALVEEMDIESERQRVAEQIRPYVLQDTRKPYTNDQVLAAQNSLYWFFRERRTNLEAMLPPASEE